ncbi:EI24 domain-containing protein [uncultured Sanguibacteroides sp.]|uniref:EI24 domain-containing protein n=1 Tax=uncultured Sanguibacteroides sp. TaxID=1635151 RepID=UPI0025CCE28B|nr:EI24 domain-containing protein [uncultured Sanguibacteroides sp.]
MAFFQGLWFGIKSYREAGRILFSRSFRWFMILPLLVAFILFLAGNYFAASWGESLSDIVQQKITAWIAGISWLEWLNEGVGFVIRFLIRVFYFFLFITWGGYIVMVVMSPVYSWLSERVEARLSRVNYPFDLKQLLWEIGRGVVVAVRCMLFQTLLMIFLFFGSFLPVVGLITPVLTFIVSAYFYGFAFMDYAIERKRFKVKESMRYMKRNAGVVIGIGTIFALSLAIPFLRVIACSIVSLFSVVAGTVVVEEYINTENRIENR